MKWMALSSLLLALAGCLSFTSTENQVMSSLYSVQSKAYQDIKGDFTVDTFLLYKKMLPSNETFTVSRWSTTHGAYHTAEAQFVGSDWRFMEEIHLQTDDGLFSYEDNDPRRTVLSGRGLVEEVVRVELDGGALTSLRSTSTLRIQFYAGPIEIPAEGIIALQQFLKQ